jgi:hypothetical protein
LATKNIIIRLIRRRERGIGDGGIRDRGIEVEAMRREGMGEKEEE